MRILLKSFLTFVVIANCISCAFLEVKPKVETGQSIAEVRTNRGEPVRSMQIGSTTVDHYGTSIVVFRNNHVENTWPLSQHPNNYLINVSALSSGPPQGKVAIFSGIDGINANSLQFQEAQKYLAKIFKDIGIEITTDPKDADVFVSLYYAISDPDVNVEEISVPIFGYDPGTSSTTQITGAVNLTSTTATQGKGLYVSGYRSETIKRVNYNRVLIVKAIEAKQFRKNKEEKEIWEVRASSFGRSDDIRLILPALFAASWPLIGKSSVAQEHVQLTDGKLELQILRFVPID